MYRHHPGGLPLCTAAILAACSYVPPPSWRHAAMYRRLLAACSYVPPPSWRHAAMYRRHPGGMQLCTAAILAAFLPLGATANGDY